MNNNIEAAREALLDVFKFVLQCRGHTDLARDRSLAFAKCDIDTAESLENLLLQDGSPAVGLGPSLDDPLEILMLRSTTPGRWGNQHRWHGYRCSARLSCNRFGLDYRRRGGVRRTCRRGIFWCA